MAIINLQSSKKSSLVLFGKRGILDDKKYNTAMVDPDTGKFVYPEGYSITTENLQEQIDDIIAHGLQYEVVDLLPAIPKEGKIYYKRITNPSAAEQEYVEYTWVNDPELGFRWVKWGSDFANQYIESGTFTLTTPASDTKVDLFGTKIYKYNITGNRFAIDISAIEYPFEMDVVDNLGSHVVYTFENQHLISKEIMSTDEMNLSFIIEDSILAGVSQNENITSLDITIIKL